MYNIFGLLAMFALWCVAMKEAVEIIREIIESTSRISKFWKSLRLGIWVTLIIFGGWVILQFLVNHY